MTVPARSPSSAPSKRPRRALGLSVAGLLGLAAALLISSCGSTGAGLIPASNAGPLQSDFETVAQAAEMGDGSCAATKEAITKTEGDFDALPRAVDNGLRNTLKQGIANLRARALVLCSQPLAQTTTTSAAPKTTTSTATTAPPVTQTTTTPTTPTSTTPTTTTPAGGGGTAAPNPGETPPGPRSGQGGGTGVSENAPAGGGPPGGETPGGGAGAGAQEGGK
jgi:hypothetical protein